MTPEQMKWVQQGLDKGWITQPYCDRHDSSADEDEDVLNELFEHSGGDHCMTVVRIKTTELQDQLDSYRSELANESLD